jgi:hypothetical protein
MLGGWGRGGGGGVRVGIQAAEQAPQHERARTRVHASGRAHMTRGSPGVAAQVVGEVRQRVQPRPQAQPRRAAPRAWRRRGGAPPQRRGALGGAGRRGAGGGGTLVAGQEGAC